jgi:hypothetical protein
MDYRQRQSDSFYRATLDVIGGGDSLGGALNRHVEARSVRRAGAWLCLATYLSGLFGFLPGVLAGGAWLDGSHLIDFRYRPGEFELILRHDTESSRSRPPSTGIFLHHHGCLARVLCALAGPGTNDSDHFIHLTAPDSISEPNPCNLGRVARPPLPSAPRVGWNEIAFLHLMPALLDTRPGDYSTRVPFARSAVLLL